jgi:hypothetical protein
MPTKQAPNLLIPPHLVEHLSFVAHDKRYEAMKIVFPDAYALIDKIDELIQFVEKQIDRKQPVLAIKE